MNRNKLPKTGTIEVCPSILSADFANLEAEIKDVERAGIKMLHLDIMDGHFVPNMTIGPVVVAKIRKCSDLVFDTHLMITDPETYAPKFIEAGSDHITFHIETVKDASSFIDRLHDMGVTCGVTLNPETPVETVLDVAPKCDMILVMTVHPGFGGQSFIDEAAQKCKRIREAAGPDVRIEVDGGINAETTPKVIEYGADTLVAGHAIFSKPDRAAAIEAMRTAVR